ncbi:MAG: hypothetical protein JWN38_1219 [Candidatus Saccharibacteria bacterium]|nr:hypothetical protein [Candidatus Saccharibacteria bacterium]
MFKKSPPHGDEDFELSRSERLVFREFEHAYGQEFRRRSRKIRWEAIDDVTKTRWAAIGACGIALSLVAGVLIDQTVQDNGGSDDTTITAAGYESQLLTEVRYDDFSPAPGSFVYDQAADHPIRFLQPLIGNCQVLFTAKPATTMSARGSTALPTIDSYTLQTASGVAPQMFHNFAEFTSNYPPTTACAALASIAVENTPLALAPSTATS